MVKSPLLNGYRLKNQKQRFSMKKKEKEIQDLFHPMGPNFRRSATTA
jgi:hypothetical protein